MINDKDRIVKFLDSTINNVYKILPLYEEKNIGLETYIESLIFDLKSSDKNIDIKYSGEFISLLNILTSIKEEISKSDCKQSTIKRETFKSINIIKTMMIKVKRDI